MLTRRIAASACALALVAPAAAVAHPADNGPAANRTGVVYGSTQYDLQNQKDLWGARETVPTTAVPGDTVAPGQQKYDLPPSGTADVYVPPADPTKVYGVSKTPTPASTPVASADDTNDGWQIAAIAEAGVLAALAFGSVALVRARRRSPLGA